MSRGVFHPPQNDLAKYDYFSSRDCLPAEETCEMLYCNCLITKVMESRGRSRPAFGEYF